MVSGAKVQAMDLSVSPKLCITDKADKTCEMTLDFVWQTNDSGDYCLVEKASQAPLQCWQQDSSGQWQAITVVTNKQVFWMSEDGTAAPLDQEVVEVLSTYSDDRRKNRRRKHVWSLM
jgi:hypothetical protein